MMNAAELLERVRASSGLTQEELARRAETSRPTLSAYEHGRKSPTVTTFARLLSRAAVFAVGAGPQVPDGPPLCPAPPQGGVGAGGGAAGVISRSAVRARTA